ncbi:PD-(D/E)XK nuclease superfamily protein [Bradyrhizobium sp. R2.2-H]|uniref:PD-(D/E)XK nuclease family protein n=1 Tax=Bradyrhizobium sp. Y-H1 TaxID=2485167 RepID=UPI00104D77A5|nr:PD-(D/E)XK nuclease family protein [Bradyrhizobium sp. Y-H1]TCU63739.1 PD-(D/E)XK nuclease superfamily protein [Bradyrhizobium sp. Y-H1]TCU65749.1 PD-(D/E)XK nuclease superfamily protein [Bradyrhizobium sp. R2.2-H]
MQVRRTVVVHTTLAGHMVRVNAARRNEAGVQVMTMGQLAARLAGGLLQPVDLNVLTEVIGAALPDILMGELEPIKGLPGMAAAVCSTFDKAWRAGIDLSKVGHPRTDALAALEQVVIDRLPASMKRPSDLIEMALRRMGHAPVIVGALEVQGHSEMSPCWRPLLTALAETIPVSWSAGPRHVPDWLKSTKVEVLAAPATDPQPRVFSCANPIHEVGEAFRWMRALLAKGISASDIAIVAASPGDYDDHVFSTSRDANIPIHFVHGIKALTGADGQATAALAEVLTKGLSQERVRRLFTLMRGGPLSDLPGGWMRLLPVDAPLTSEERWERVLKQPEDSDWPDGKNRTAEVLEVIRLLGQGTDAAELAGETLLIGVQRSLWRRALREGPAQALSVTLAGLRIEDGIEPAANAIWTSAIALASAPRPHVWLLGLNAGRWPRRISEDRLIPDHVLPIDQLDPLPVADGDKRDIKTIVGTAQSVAISFSRRDAEGRMLGRSPIISDIPDPETYLDRAGAPEHAFSEADRLLARPSEFSTLPIAISGLSCWRDWHRSEITAHDGLIAAEHARLKKLLERPLSATSLKLLLRDPIRFVWRYALGWKAPEDADEPLTLEANAFGNFVHALLRDAVEQLEGNGGIAAAEQAQIEAALVGARERAVALWESAQPVPPDVIWRNAVARGHALAAAALAYGLEPLPNQKTWCEIPFGKVDPKSEGRELPWSLGAPVEIPGTGLLVEGQIDRLDLSGDGARARVTDYKTGKLSKKMDEVVIKGGAELQRCLYAFAVKTLLGDGVTIEASLLYPNAPESDQALFPLADLDGALAKVSTAAVASRTAMLGGLAPPGEDAASDYNDHAFALPANAGYLPRKLPLAITALGPAAAVWGEP